MPLCQLIFVFSIDCDNNSLTNSEIQQFNNNDAILMTKINVKWRQELGLKIIMAADPTLTVINTIIIKGTMCNNHSFQTCE